MDGQRGYEMMGTHVHPSMYEPDQIVANDYKGMDDQWQGSRYK